MEAKQNDLYETLHKLMYCSNSTHIKNLVIHHNEKDKWSIHVNFITEAEQQVIDDLVTEYDAK
tara:strand:+ start:757 stop:945 length:189 start_codon:yes stop_codon:yes gene_type:complete